MTKFEAVILFNPDLSTLIIEKEEKNIINNIESSKGSIISTEDWGLRDLSYNIKNYKKAFYKYYQVEVNESTIENLKKIMKQNKKILRHMFVKVENHQVLPTKMMINEEK